ncbi:YitT family protein [Fusobacterium varium]|nr:YitT family protein [Fusobacterium varium]
MSNKFIKLGKDYFFMTLGCFIYAFAVNYFYVSNHLAEGGVTGIALIIYYLFKTPVGITYFVVNIPLLILGWKMLGKDFIIKTLYGTIMMSVALGLTEGMNGATSDTILASLYGGFIGGIGLGLIFLCGGSTGGTDIVARIMSKYRGIPVGKAMLILDVIVLSVVAFLFGKEVFMYTLIAAVVLTKTIDFVQEGMDKAKAVTIISKKSDLLKEELMKETERGVTILNGMGAYTDNNLDIIYCVVSKYQIIKVKRIVKEIDPHAFLTITDVSEVLGEGFKNIKDE